MTSANLARVVWKYKTPDPDRRNEGNGEFIPQENAKAWVDHCNKICDDMKHWIEN